jgi:hypothetical protein
MPELELSTAPRAGAVHRARTGAVRHGRLRAELELSDVPDLGYLFAVPRRDGRPAAWHLQDSTRRSPWRRS